MTPKETPKLDLEALGEIATSPLTKQLVAYAKELEAEVRRLRATPPQGGALATKKTQWLRLAEDLLRSAINIAEEDNPNWYKNSDEKIAAIKALKAKWDEEAAAISTGKAQGGADLREAATEALAMLDKGYLGAIFDAREKLRAALSTPTDPITGAGKLVEPTPRDALTTMAGEAMLFPKGRKRAPKALKGGIMDKDICRGWWDGENQDFLTACREVSPAQRKICGHCRRPVKVVSKFDDLNPEAPEALKGGDHG